MKPFTLLIKPSGSNCNIDCVYCFYKDRDPAAGTGTQRMSEKVLEKLVGDYMQLGFPVVGFAWQGGEPTLMGVDFFRKAIEFQKKYGTPGQQISNTLQTNGVLLDEQWCRFFGENRFLLGISMDGPAEFHDKYRRDHSGSPTFEKVWAGVQNCKRFGVQFNALILLNRHNVEHVERLFDFVVDNELRYVQFIPCVEIDPATQEPAEFSITPGQYGDFLCRLFDLWHDYGPEKINIRDFDSIVTHYVLGDHTICAYSKKCAGFVVIEHNGDAYCCEFFVGPDYKLGNITENSLGELANSKLKRDFARTKLKLSTDCLVCGYLDICRGGCLKDRARAGGLNARSYFCDAYKQFFHHSLPRFMQMAADIDEGKTKRMTRPAEKVRLRL